MLLLFLPRASFSTSDIAGFSDGGGGGRSAGIGFKCERGGGGGGEGTDIGCKDGDIAEYAAAGVTGVGGGELVQRLSKV